MKTAFNILPDTEMVEQLHLLIETGNYGVSFVWFDKDPLNLKGLAVYNFKDHETPTNITRAIENIFITSPVFEKQPKSVTLCFNFPEAVFVPGVLYKANASGKMLSLLYDCDERFDIKTDIINGHHNLHVYAINKQIAACFNEKYPNATINHSGSLLLEQIRPDALNLVVTFYHNSFRVFLMDKENLLYSGQFDFSVPTDAIYHLLNCCKQYDVAVDEVVLKVRGMIDPSSNLYNELSKYFLKIEFVQPESDTIMHDRIKFYPAHFFSHLTAMASCV